MIHTQNPLYTGKKHTPTSDSLWFYFFSFRVSTLIHLFSHSFIHSFISNDQRLFKDVGVYAVRALLMNLATYIPVQQSSQSSSKRKLYIRFVYSMLFSGYEQQ